MAGREAAIYEREVARKGGFGHGGREIESVEKIGRGEKTKGDANEQNGDGEELRGDVKEIKSDVVELKGEIKRTSENVKSLIDGYRTLREGQNETIKEIKRPRNN